MYNGNFASLAFARSGWYCSRAMVATSRSERSSEPNCTALGIRAVSFAAKSVWWWFWGFIGLVGLAKVGSGRNRSGYSPESPASGSVKSEIKELIEYHGARVGLDVHGVSVCKAICAQESSFTDPERLGDAGEVGPMQVTPVAMQDMNYFIDLDSSLSDKIFAGCQWVKHLLNLSQQQLGRPYGQDVYTVQMYRLAIRAYNAGFNGALRGRGFGYLSLVKQKGNLTWV